MFGHRAWMFKRGCYIDGDPVNGAGGEIATPPDTGDKGQDADTDTDKDDFSGDDFDKEPEGEPDPGDEPGDSDSPDQKPRTSKQPPEVDAAFKRARLAEEKAAQLERELAEKRDAEARAQQQQNEAEHKAALDKEWNTVLQEAEQLKAEGYGERYVNEFIRSNRERIISREEVKALKQELEQSKKRSEQATQQAQTVHAVKSFFVEVGELRKQYGDLIPDPAGIKDDVDGFMQYTKQLPPEMVEKIARGYSPTDAFLVANHGKISTREKSLEQKRTVANLSDRQRRGITSEGEGTAASYGVDVNSEMAEAFGNDPKEIAKYVKQQTKSRR